MSNGILAGFVVPQSDCLVRRRAGGISSTCG
jgi:hypothetical protein